MKRPNGAPKTPRPGALSRREFLILQGLGSAGLVALGTNAFGAQDEPPTSGRAAPATSKRPVAPRELLSAIERGDAERVETILRENPALAAARDDEGRSIFVLAYLAGHPSIATIIKEHGIELDLVEAILDGDGALVAKLAEESAPTINALHPIGGTAFFAAALFGRQGAIFPLLRWGADPNVNPLGANGVTATRAALDCADRDNAEAAAIRIMVDVGDVNAPQRKNDTVLHAAARLGSPDLVEFVIRKGGRVGVSNADGKTPLEVALEHGHTAAADVLRNHAQVPRDYSSSRRAYNGAGGKYSPSADDAIGQLVINEFSLVCHFDFDRVKRLAGEYPGLVHANSTWNELGIEATAHVGRPDMTAYLLERGAPMSLPTCIMMGESRRARELLEEDVERIRERGPHDFALMWYPQIAGGKTELAELLLDFGSDINEEKMGVTLLHRAAYWGQKDLVRFLIERGAELNPVGQSDFSPDHGTPLDFALEQGREEISQLLREHGARRWSDPA